VWRSDRSISDHHTPRYLLFVWLLGPQGGQISSAGLDAELATLWLRIVVISRTEVDSISANIGWLIVREANKY
jgi:hypothetical protein